MSRKEFEIAYVPIGVPTFELVSAGELFKESGDALTELAPADSKVVLPGEMLLSIDKLNAFLDRVDPDLIVLQNITFANSAYASEVMSRFQCPVLLWTLREPVIDGGRLRLNSLTGAFSAAHTIRQFRREPFEYIYGAPSEIKVRHMLGAVMRAAKIKWDMKSLRLASIGHTPEGFGFGRALDEDLLIRFGVHQESIEVRELIERAKGFQDDEIEGYLIDASDRICGLEQIPEINRKDFARLYKAYWEYITTHKISALASRCWPDLFTAFGTPNCAVLGILNDRGIAAGCETDVYGALSMYIGMKLTGHPVFFGDPVSLDETENTITFWHCGTAACSLAREDTGAEAGVHCNRKIGPTLEFGAKAFENATIFRIGRTPEGDFRFFITSGKILDKPKQFSGTSMVVETCMNAENIVKSAVKDGWEPHFVVVYGDIADELEVLGHMLGMEVSRY